MTSIYKKWKMLLWSVALPAFLYSCNTTDPTEPSTPTGVSGKVAETYTNEVAVKWTDLQLKLIKTTAGYVPPVAARANAYSYLALYEAIVPGMTGFQSLKGQLSGLSTLPSPANGEYNWALAANAALYHINKSIYSTTSAANKSTMDSLNTALESTFKGSSAADVIARSNTYGKAIADAIYTYSLSDGGATGYANNFPTDYVLPVGAGKWVPTGPQKIPLLPYWGKNRFFAPKNSDLTPQAPPAFSYNTNSTYFKEAMEVYNVKQNLTAEQTAIAKFWADGGGTFTPPGHYANIATIALRKENANLSKAAETYAKLGLALSDAFTCCWKFKYIFNTMRPYTYIRETIDPKWTPLLATPPFPEYTSGHSSGSGAMNAILTSVFGASYSFTDNTNAPARSFTSFKMAGDEARDSRLFGGIHYASGNTNGQINGNLIGNNILALKFKK